MNETSGTLALETARVAWHCGRALRSCVIEEQARKTPDAVAVVVDTRKVTYRDLDGCANRLAHYLASYAVGPDFLVGVCVDRSEDMLIAMLAVLKAGGAYVPLDPAFPGDRLAWMFPSTPESRGGC